MKRLLPWLIIGLVVRLVLIPLTLHPDFRAVNLAAYWIAQKGEIFTFYDHISKLPRSDHLVNLYGDNLFIYPPIAYLSHAVFNKLLFWAYPQNAFWTLINDIGKLKLDPQFPILLYLLKLPYLFADILCLFVLYKILPSKEKFSGSLIWIFNPVTIYTSYMLSQFDIFIALFLIITLYFTNKKSKLAAISLGLSACFKPFTLCLAPLLPGSKIKNTSLAFGTYLISIVPYLLSPAFKQYALLASQTDKMFYAKILISGSQYIPVFILGLILIYWWNYLRDNDLPIWAWLMVPLLLFYSVTHYHPQWFVWVTPLIVMSWVNAPKIRLLLVALISCYFVIVLFFEPSLNFGLFGINFSLFDYVNRFYQSDQFLSVIRGVFAGTSIALIFKLLPKNR